MRKRKRTTNSISIRAAISPELLEHLRDRAEAESRTVSGMIRLILEQDYKLHQK